MPVILWELNPNEGNNFLKSSINFKFRPNVVFNLIESTLFYWLKVQFKINALTPWHHCSRKFKITEQFQKTQQYFNKPFVFSMPFASECLKCNWLATFTGGEYLMKIFEFTLISLKNTIIFLYFPNIPNSFTWSYS